MLYVFAIVILFLGLFMIFMPKQSVKKENRGSEKAIKKARRNGIIISLVAIIFIIVLFIFDKNDNNNVLNDNNEENSNILNLCTALEYDITSYENDFIDWDEFVSRIEEASKECDDVESELCIHLNSTLILNTERDEVKNAYIKQLRVSCEKENN